MMTINKRIKNIRSELKLTQIDFGSKLGISQSHLTSIENGKRTVTEKTLKIICATYNVNEEWLREGAGGIFKEDDESILNSLIMQYSLDELDRQIIEIFIGLPEAQRNSVKNFLFGFANKTKTAEEALGYRPVKPTPRSELEKKADEIAEIARMQFLEEKREELASQGHGLDIGTEIIKTNNTIELNKRKLA